MHYIINNPLVMQLNWKKRTYQWNDFQFLISDTTVTLKSDQHYREQYKREQHECVKLCRFCPIQKLKGYLSHFIFKQKSQTAVSKLEDNLIHVTSFHYNDWFTHTLIFLMPLSRSRSSKCVVVEQRRALETWKFSLKSPLKQLPQKIKCCLSTIKSGEYQFSPSNTTAKQNQNKHHKHHTPIHICVHSFVHLFNP